MLLRTDIQASSEFLSKALRGTTLKLFSRFQGVKAGRWVPAESPGMRWRLCLWLWNDHTPINSRCHTGLLATFLFVDLIQGQSLHLCIISDGRQLAGLLYNGRRGLASVWHWRRTWKILGVKDLDLSLHLGDLWKVTKPFSASVSLPRKKRWWEYSLQRVVWRFRGNNTFVCNKQETSIWK